MADQRKCLHVGDSRTFRILKLSFWENLKLLEMETCHMKSIFNIETSNKRWFLISFHRYASGLWRSVISRISHLRRGDGGPVWLLGRKKHSVTKISLYPDNVSFGTSGNPRRSKLDNITDITSCLLIRDGMHHPGPQLDNRHSDVLCK